MARLLSVPALRMVGVNGALTEILAGWSRELAGLLPTVRGCAGVEVVDAQRELETLSRVVLAAQAELDAAVADGGSQSEQGYASVRAMLDRCAPVAAAGGHRAGAAPRAAGVAAFAVG